MFRDTGMFRLSASATLFAVALTASSAVSAQQSDIRIDHAWSRAAMAGRTGVVYLTITDTGLADRLTGVSSPVAEKAELHESFSDNGVMKMRHVAALPVANGQPVSLSPGGHHIMLVHLKQALKEGDLVPLTLTFEKAGAVSTTATVAKAGAAAMPAAGHMEDMPMGNMRH
jgi:periplasmic copper chaperone A